MASTELGIAALAGEAVALQSNLPVNTDAHERPLPSVAPVRVRRLRLR
jgi:hypothetical protein